MEIVTTDGRLLYIERIGDIDKDKGTNMVLCTDKNRKKTIITPAEIALFLGSYSFPPLKEK
jgi:hypothetical protein